jgi:hypothetical protein
MATTATVSPSDLTRLVTKSYASYGINNSGFELAIHIPLRKDIGTTNEVERMSESLADTFGVNSGFSASRRSPGRLFMALYSGTTRKDRDHPDFVKEIPMITRAAAMLVELLPDFVDVEHLFKLLRS